MKDRLSLPGFFRLCVFACVGAFVVACLPAYGVPANPAGVDLPQPDGSTARIFLRGDERVHWNEDSLGYLVTKSAATGAWVYARHDNGKIVPTKHVVGRANPKALGLEKPDVRRMSAAGAATGQVSPAPALATPAVGLRKNLVILVNFTNETISYSSAQYNALFNQVGYSYDGASGSVKDFYLEASGGQLEVQSTVVGPVTVSNTHAYYGTDGSDIDVRVSRELVEEAINLVDATGFDFSTMDSDGDGWIDCLTIIHAGGGQEYGGNPDTYIWAHYSRMTTSSGLAKTVTKDGTKLSYYHIEPARRGWDSLPSSWGITRIGVTCHEMGHFFGLPDLYDYGGDSYGIGSFCLMANGSWNGNYGTRPAHPSAWCKVKLDWATPTVITSPGSYSISRVQTSGQIYKIQGNFPSSQYFLVENRQGYGFDASLPGGQRGLLIWHVDETTSNNNNQSHYKVDLEEASGTQHLELYLNQGDDSDYFRAGNVTRFGHNTTPNNRSYTGSTLGLNITSVSPSGPTMTFYVDNGAMPPAAISPSGGVFPSAQNVTITCPATDATIRYTTDGSDPTESSPSIMSGGTVNIGASGTIKTKAFLAGWNPSDVTIGDFTIVSTDSHIKEAKAAADGTDIACKSVLVTAVFGSGVFYIGETDYTGGLRVVKPDHGVGVNSFVDVAGTLATTTDGERYIDAGGVNLLAGSETPRPIGLNTGAVVGGDYQYSAGPPIEGQIGIEGAVGLNNVGLLVRTWGYVTERASDGSYVTIDDGSGAGVKVLLTEQSVPITKNLQVGHYVGICGISTITKDSGVLKPAVRPRDDSDIIIY